MSKVLIIGAGGVGKVVVTKCAQHPDIFTEILFASRTVSKCDKIVENISHPNISTATIDAEDVPALVKLMKSFKPFMVIHVALPYQDLTIMDACLECGVHYLDTANYEPKDEAKFEYSWQWAYQERFKAKGIMALLEKGKLVGLIGGDHSTPYGFLKALNEKHEEFGVLQFDAHLDLREAYEGFEWSHASIFYNALKLPAISQLTQVGIRDFCEEELEVVKSNWDLIKVFFDHDIRRQLFSGNSFDKIVDTIIFSLPEKVYVSFDVDALIPELCPNTGTPVPGGLSFQEAVFILKKLKDSGRTIIGFDVNEVNGDFDTIDGNVGARLVYKLANLMGK